MSDPIVNISIQITSEEFGCMSHCIALHSFCPGKANMLGVKPVKTVMS
jgi:hypothetical protein